MRRRNSGLAATGPVEADYRVFVVHLVRSKYEYPSIADAELALAAVDVTTGAFAVFDTDGYEWLPVPEGGAVRLQRLHLAPEQARHALHLERYGSRIQLAPYSWVRVACVLALVGFVAGTGRGDTWALVFGCVGLLAGWALYRVADRRGWVVNRARRARPWWDGLRARRRSGGRAG